MKKTIVLTVAVLALTSCAGPVKQDAVSVSRQEDRASSEILEQEPEPEEIAPESKPDDSPEQAADFDTLVSQARQQGLVVDSAFATPLENNLQLVEWVQSYRRGAPGTITVLLEGPVYSSGLFVLESDGSSTYTITEHRKALDGEDTLSPLTYRSSVIIERAYDYVFGGDVSAAERPHALVVHHSPLPIPAEVAWSPENDAPFYGVTPLEAEQRAEEVNSKIYRHMSVIPNIYGGGIYLKESVLKAVAEDYESPLFHYKTVGAVRLGDHLCYLVYGNADIDALERGEHGGSVTAVSTDGALVWIKSMVDGAWIFADDDNQATYPGAWPEVEGFYPKAYAMGYTDQQLAFLASASWFSANTMLNLTKKHSTGFAAGWEGDDRYTLDGYTVDSGGEAMLACMYLRDNQTGRVTILPDWQNGYSSFGFLDGETFCAAIAQVGGADYEAGVRFYHAAAPEQPYARWDLTDSQGDLGSEMTKILLTASYSEDSDRLVAFWCEIPEAWSGWLKEDTQTYRATILDRQGTVVKSLDTGVALIESPMGITPPSCRPNNSLPPVLGAIYFEVADVTYLLNLESGEVVKAE